MRYTILTLACLMCAAAVATPTKTPTWSSIVDSHDKHTSPETKNFAGETLGYVTPWNAHGYDVAKIFRHKFTYISPVWYLLRSENDKFKIVGRHDVDSEWMSQVRLNSTTQITPRFYFDQLSAQQITSKLLKKKSQRKRLFKMIVKECIQMGFDGIVLDLASIGVYTFLKDWTDILSELSSALHKENLKIILTVMPDRNIPNSFDSAELSTLISRLKIDRFSVMTYDFSSGAHKAGPSSPIEWVHSNIHKLLLSQKSVTGRSVTASKLLMGTNFYGYDFDVGNAQNSRPIVSHEYIGLLRTHKPAKITLERTSQEHSFSYKTAQSTHKVYFPTLYSLNERLKLMSEMGTGLSIWELGQGLDSFLDLL